MFYYNLNLLLNSQQNNNKLFIDEEKFPKLDTDIYKLFLPRIFQFKFYQFSPRTRILTKKTTQSYNKMSLFY